MPKLAKRPDPHAEYVDAVLQARAAFEEGFQRSEKGNLWRLWGGATITVYQRSDGYYGWCRAGSDPKPRFSAAGWETEEEALSCLASELAVGEP